MNTIQDSLTSSLEDSASAPTPGSSGGRADAGVDRPVPVCTDETAVEVKGGARCSKHYAAAALLGVGIAVAILCVAVLDSTAPPAPPVTAKPSQSPTSTPTQSPTTWQYAAAANCGRGSQPAAANGCPRCCTPQPQWRRRQLFNSASRATVCLCLYPALLGAQYATRDAEYKGSVTQVRESMFSMASALSFHGNVHVAKSHDPQRGLLLYSKLVTEVSIGPAGVAGRYHNALEWSTQGVTRRQTEKWSQPGV